MQLPFITLDVFTQTRFSGNPLAIVTIPTSSSSSSSSSSSTITPALKQSIAREFNLSETVLIHDIPTPSPIRTIDIYLTHAEIPFAGHPIIGAAVSLLPQGVSRLITKAGPIDISPAGPNSASARVPHDLHIHSRRLADILPPLPLSPSNPSSSTSAKPSSIASLELAAPIVSFVKGVSFILIQLPSLPLLADIHPGGPPLSPADLLDPGWDHGSLGRYYYVLTGSDSDSDSDSDSADGSTLIRIRARMVLSTLEDPATGSAACCLASYLSTQQPTQPSASHHYEITQGVEMGQSSHISVHVALQDSLIQSVTLAGSAVQVMSGTITV